jgi:hypothetical protein
MRTLALLVLAGLFAVGCHNNKPAAQPTQNAPAQPAPVQGPPP